MHVDCLLSTFMVNLKILESYSSQKKVRLGSQATQQTSKKNKFLGFELSWPVLQGLLASIVAET